MNDLMMTTNYELPANIEDLSKFVLIGREKLVAVRAAIRAIDKLEVAQDVREQKLHEAQAISEAVLDAEVKIGQLMKNLPKASGGDRRSENFKNDSGVDFEKSKTEVIKDAGFTLKQAERFQQLADNQELVEQAKQEARANDDIVSRSAVLNKIKSQKKADEIEQAKAKIASQASNECESVIRIGDGINYKPSESYDLLLTDPPYSTDIEDINDFAQSWLPNALEHVKPTGSAYVFIGAYPEELRAYLNVKIPEHMNFIQVLIWTYKNTLGNNPKNRYKQNYQACLFYRGVNAPALDCPLTNEQWAVQEINAPDGRLGDRYHAWQKPIEIAERFIRHSTKQGETVFDPFACTGTFLLAAAKLGRNGYGFEISPENAKIAEQRGVKIIE